MKTPSALAVTIGRLIGVGPGRGIGLLFLLLGMGLVAAALMTYLDIRIRRVEDELPDASIANLWSRRIQA